ncbi:hypothetical protein, partial [Mycobacterium saskatchewanense]|uniref:hypothetical protein n=1 Tax=Mycobacterium saskatchewanense TaxID=220927 RepID=UPI001F16CFD3
MTTLPRVLLPDDTVALEQRQRLAYRRARNTEELAQSTRNQLLARNELSVEEHPPEHLVLGRVPLLFSDDAHRHAPPASAYMGFSYVKPLPVGKAFGGCCGRCEGGER